MCLRLSTWFLDVATNKTVWVVQTALIDDPNRLDLNHVHTEHLQALEEDGGIHVQVYGLRMDCLEQCLEQCSEQGLGVKYQSLDLYHALKQEWGSNPPPLF